MNAHEYHEAAMRTGREPVPNAYFTNDDARNRLLHAALGVAGEVGELVDHYKRHIFYGAPIDRVNVIEECGDLLWFCTLAYDQVRIDISYAVEACGGASSAYADAAPLALLCRLQGFAAHVFGCVGMERNNDSPFWYGIRGDVREIVCLVRALLATVGATLEDAMRANTAKLAKRYPDKFTREHALNRDLDAERAALESKV
jgi:NTP pyrophosphatase (non-canonical NTP hydrolase)